MKNKRLSNQANISIFLLLFLFLAATIGMAYFYFEKEKLMELHLQKVETLNQKVISLSEKTKLKEVENIEMRKTLELTQKEYGILKKQYEELQRKESTFDEIQLLIQKEFDSINLTLKQGFAGFNEFSNFFDSKVDSIMARNTQEIGRVVSEQVKDLAKIGSSVQLPKVVVLPESNQGVQPATVSLGDDTSSTETGVKVMKVNEEYGFLVMNQGLVDGVKKGEKIEVTRGDLKVATGLVTEVRELVSLAKVDKQFGLSYVQVGDAIRLK